MKSAVVFVSCLMLLGIAAVTNARRRNRPRFCNLPAVSGTGKENRKSWYYNCKTRSCELFIYGGCGGNRNTFSTERACRRTCKAKCRGLVHCHLKCKSGFMKDIRGCPICQCVDVCKTMECSSREECVEHVNPCFFPPCPAFGVCVDICKLPQKIGPCHRRLRRWFYNKDHCEKFDYGGCGGNGNNFKTKDECKRMCQCPPLTCDKDCEFGTEFDKSGCPTCRCLGNPCAFTSCLQGYKCVPQKLTTPCTGIGCPPRAKCFKVLQCPKRCEFGYAFDQAGNPTCKCGTPACHFMRCGSGTKCINTIVPFNCAGSECRPRGRCVKVLQCPRRCPFGYEFDNSGNPTCKCGIPACHYMKCALGWCVDRIVPFPCAGRQCHPSGFCAKAKPGSCPQQPKRCLGQRYTTCGQWCSTDSDCSGKKRCCFYDEPPRYKCVDPVPY